MKYKDIKPEQPIIKSWYLEDELSDGDQPKKEDIQAACKMFKLPFTKKYAMAIIYGDNEMTPERILPFWFNELED